VDKRIKVWTGGASFAAGAPPVYKAEDSRKAAQRAAMCFDQRLRLAALSHVALDELAARLSRHHRRR